MISCFNSFRVILTQHKPYIYNSHMESRSPIFKTDRKAQFHRSPYISEKAIKTCSYIHLFDVILRPVVTIFIYVQFNKIRICNRGGNIILG
jgi:hypothetical protein